MNLLDKRKAGLMFLLTLFLFACESDDELGLSLDPNIANLNTYYKEITVPFKLVQLDSVNTTVTSSSNKRILIGNYTNERFGTVSATGFTDFSITNKGTISENDTFDSLALVMVNNYYYGALFPAQPQTFSVHQLTQTLENRFHYQFETVPFNTATSLGALTFSPDPKVASSNDTLRITLSDVVGQDLFNKAKNKAPELSTDSLFQEYFKGLAFVPQSENDYITGFAPTQTRMVMYYSAPDDTVSSTYTFGLGTTITFSHIEYDRTGTPIAGINSNNQHGSASNENFYLQSGTGLAPMLNFQPLIDFADSIQEEGHHILFNNIDLYIGFAKADSASRPPSVIKGYYTTDMPDRLSVNNESLGLFSNNANSTVASEIMLDSLSRYRLQISRYMQALVNEQQGVESNVLLLAPDFESSLNQITTPADSVRLKIYYSILE